MPIKHLPLALLGTVIGVVLFMYPLEHGWIDVHAFSQAGFFFYMLAAMGVGLLVGHIAIKILLYYVNRF
jgi:uncharacterized membrane protein (DUF441 family)